MFVRTRSNFSRVSCLIWVSRASARFFISCTISALWSNPLRVKSPSKPSPRKRRGRHPVANIVGAVPVFVVSNSLPAAIANQTHSCGETSGDDPSERQRARILRRRRWIKRSTLPCCHGAPTADVELMTPQRVIADMNSRVIQARFWSLQSRRGAPRTANHPGINTLSVLSVPMSSRMNAREYAVNESTMNNKCFVKVGTPIRLNSTSPTSIMRTALKNRALMGRTAWYLPRGNASIAQMAHLNVMARRCK